MAFTNTSPLVAKQRAIIAAKNVQVSKYYAEFLGSYIFLFILLNLAYFLSHALIKRFPTTITILSFPGRISRRYLIRKIPFFDSLGHAVTISVYWAVIIVLAIALSPGMPINSPRNWVAKRFGWMSILNMTAAMVLSVKNTPLGFLTGYSHERLNVLHRTAGFAAFVCSIVHFSMYTAYFVKEHSVQHGLASEEQVHGWVAWAFLFLMCLSGFRPLRQRFYEIFLKIHTVGYILVMVNVALHKPEKARKVAWILTFAGSCWASGRIVRFLKMIYNSYGNAATLVALDGATKVVLDKPLSAKPGDHVFISIPAIRFFESHPFTISDTKTTQLRVRKRTGFTAALHRYAEKNPHAKVKILVEGPFGATPNFKTFDKILLIAGGVGGTFMFPIALDIVRSATWESGKVVKMIWAIRSETHMEWFREEISEIQRSNRIDLTVFTTQSGEIPASPIQEIQDLADILEKAPEPEYASQESLDISQIQKEEGKPDLREAVNDFVKSAGKTDRIIISSCGPGGLMKDVRNTVAQRISISGPSITLQNEQFGW